METTAPCDYCHRREAVTTCKLCGARVCAEHDRDNGCEVCKGERKL